MTGRYLSIKVIAECGISKLMNRERTMITAAKPSPITTMASLPFSAPYLNIIGNSIDSMNVIAITTPSSEESCSSKVSPDPLRAVTTYDRTIPISEVMMIEATATTYLALTMLSLPCGSEDA